MDLLGEVVRNFLKASHSDAVRNAHSLAMELREEGMSPEQIEEMLYSSEFEEDVIKEALSTLPSKKRKVS